MKTLFAKAAGVAFATLIILGLLVISHPALGIAGRAIDVPSSPATLTTGGDLSGVLSAATVLRSNGAKVHASYAALPTCDAAGAAAFVRAVATVNAGAEVFLCQAAPWGGYYWTSGGTAFDEAAPHFAYVAAWNAAGNRVHGINAAGGNVAVTLPSCNGIPALLDFGTVGTGVFDTTIRAQTNGEHGNQITIALVADGGGATTITRVLGAFTIHYTAAVSTVANVEAAIAALPGADDYIEVYVAGTGANVIGAGDAFAATNLAGGQPDLERSFEFGRYDGIGASVVTIVGSGVLAPGTTDLIDGAAATLTIQPMQNVAMWCNGQGWLTTRWTAGMPLASAGAAPIPIGAWKVRLTAGGAVAPPLPDCAPGPMLGRSIGIKLLDANNATITADAGDTIDGAPSYLMNAQWQYAEFHCDAPGVWYLH